MQTLGYQSNNQQLVYRDTAISRPPGQSPWDNLSNLVTTDPVTALTYYDDFVLNTTGSYTATKGTGGSLTQASTIGGWASIPTAASSNDYQVLSIPASLFSLKNYTPIVFEAAVNVTEANTNKASWFVGLTSVLTTGFLANTGAPPSSYSGAVFWKAQGAMALKAQTSNSTTQNSSGALATVVSGQTYILGAYIDPKDGVTAQVTYYVSTNSGSTLARSFVTTGTLNLPVGSLAAMTFAFGIKAASGSAETLTIDYLRIVQGRPLV